MIRRKLKIFLVFLLVVIQLYSFRFFIHNKLYYDLFFIIIFYFAYKKSYLEAILAGFTLGLVTDFFSLSLLGVFSFSRTLIAALINLISNRFDLANKFFFFIFFSLALIFSNLIAFFFLNLIFGYGANVQLFLLQPLITALISSLLISIKRVKDELDII